MPAKLDLTGQVFGRLTVLRENGKHGKHILWLCRCSCGNETTAWALSLRNGGTKSCGCLKKEIQATHKFKIGHASLNALPPGEAARNKLVSYYRQSAQRRELVFALSVEQAEALFASRCFYCGASPGNVLHATRYNGDYIYSGIDRRDNLQGYTVANSVACCGICNAMKSNRSEKEFLAQVAKIYRKRVAR